MSKTGRAARRLGRSGRSTLGSTGILGKVILIGALSLMACCLCAVPVVVLAPETSDLFPGDDEAEGPGVTADLSETTAIPGEPTGTPLFPEAQRAAVVDVIDGDTIDVEIDGQNYRLRYIGIDTPERGMTFYSEATRANADLVAGKTVILVKDVSETDRFGRLLRYVYLEDGTFVNGELVRQGFAQAATFPPDVASQEDLLLLQQEARSEGLGLWSVTVTDTPPVTPQIMCTPPLCRDGEIFYCPDECPGGCGTICATVTPPG